MFVGRHEWYMKKPEPTSDADRTILRNIDTYGCDVVLVPPEEETAGWAFSVGLFHSYQHPEIVVFGLPIARKVRPRKGNGTPST